MTSGREVGPVGGVVRRIGIGLLLLLVATFGGCLALLRLGCLPERFAVNAPILHALFGRGVEAPPPSVVGSRFHVPEGFSVGLFAEGIANARFLRPTPAGDLLVSQPRAGRVWLLERDGDGDGRSDGRRALLEGLHRPHGMDLREGWLYVAEGDAVGRVRFDPGTRGTEGAFERVVTGLPEGGNHWTRTLRFGPDGWMYVSVGSSCNVCLEQDPRRAALLRFRPDGSGEEIYATGLRNTVGFDWRPGTDELYATDNGRDLLGDDFPPCELDRVVRGGFYGWPFANGDRVPDPDLGEGHDAGIAASIPPAHAFRPHNAPLGISFLRSGAAPLAYRGAALVALHGSWNRTRKDGYEVVSLHWRADGSIEERDFLTGFLEDDDVIGRPVDVAEGPDGAIYVSDDYAGAVYRVTSGGATRTAAAPTAASEPAPNSLSALSALSALSPEERRLQAERGRELFVLHDCAACHDPARATPGMVPKELRGLASRYDLTSLGAFLEAPTPPMPVVALSAQEKRDLAVHLLSEYR
jgi:glucose/arabinose dehydrogenase